MKSPLFCMAVVCALAGSADLEAQTSDKERLKANLERAFSPRESTREAETTAVSADDEAADGILYYVQVLSSVRPIEGTGDKALRTFPDLKSVREDRYLKYYTGAGTNDYRQAQALMRSVHAKGYPDAFVIAFKYGVKIPLGDALKQQGIKN